MTRPSEPGTRPTGPGWWWYDEGGVEPRIVEVDLASDHDDRMIAYLTGQPVAKWVDDMRGEFGPRIPDYDGAPAPTEATHVRVRVPVATCWCEDGGVEWSAYGRISLGDRDNEETATDMLGVIPVEVHFIEAWVPRPQPQQPTTIEAEVRDAD